MSKSSSSASVAGAKRSSGSMLDHFKPAAASSSASATTKTSSASPRKPASERPTKKMKREADDDDDDAENDPFVFEIDEKPVRQPAAASTSSKSPIKKISGPTAAAASSKKPSSSSASSTSVKKESKSDAMEIDDDESSEIDLTQTTIKTHGSTASPRKQSTAASAAATPSRTSIASPVRPSLSSASRISVAASPAKSQLSTTAAPSSASRPTASVLSKESSFGSKKTSSSASTSTKAKAREAVKRQRIDEEIEEDEDEMDAEYTTPAAAASSKSASKKPKSAAPSSRKKKVDAEQKVAAAMAAKISSDVNVVMAKVNQLRVKIEKEQEKYEQSGTKRLTLDDLNLPNVKTDVLSLGEDEVRACIERVIVTCANSILAGHGFSYEVPVRSSGNQLYVPELDRIVLKDKLADRMFASIKNGRKTAITTRILGLVYELCLKRIHVTKRDLFYTDVKLFETQGASDDVIEDVACMLGCTRTSLNVVASEKGIVVGRISFRDDGDLIDCTKMGVGGKAIPPSIDRITDIKGDAKFVLLVEKDAAFMRLAEDRFYNVYPCCIITAKGQPDVATRLFLKKVKETLKIPVLGLVDADPYGLKILSVYMSGSKNMSYDSASLTTPDIKWLGVRPSDLKKYNIPQQCRLEMTDHDIKTGKELLEEEFIQKNEEWMKELQIMVQSKEKAEIQALSSFGFQYLSKVYLPAKLQDGGWV